MAKGTEVQWRSGDVIGAANVPTAARRKVSFLLGFGIFLVPFIFAWFLLRRGYSTTARVIGLGSLAISLVAIVIEHYDRSAVLAAVGAAPGGALLHLLLSYP